MPGYPTDYAQVRMADGLPLPMDFDLLKIHPFQIGTMMSTVR